MRLIRTLLLSTIAASFAMGCTVGNDSPVDGEARDPNKFDPGVPPAYADKLAAADMGAELIDDQYIVTFDDKFVDAGAMRAEVQEAANSLLESKGISTDNIRYTYSTVLKGITMVATEDELAALAADPMVKAIEQDQVVYANETWGLDRVDQTDLPLDDVDFNPGGAFAGGGAGVNVYIVDTGIRSTHSEFAGRIGALEDTQGDNRGPEDCNGHGTHVGGTVAGTAYGLAKEATVNSVRVLGCNGSGSWAGVIGGIEWVAEQHQAVGGPSVANMSLGGGRSDALNDAVAEAIAVGVTFVVAAGNETTDACTKSPASTPSAITVGSSTSSDGRSSFSNFGTCVDIFAPGSGITSAWIGGDTDTNTISGTSMASPHVAGAAALYLANNPSKTPAEVDAALKDAGVDDKVSDVRGAPNKLLYVGDGGVAPPPPPPPPPGDGVLENGVPVAVADGARNDEQFFTIDVPAGATNLSISINGGSGDADLYVKAGARPSQSDYDCRPYLAGNTENCDVAVAQAGTYYVMVRAWSAHSAVSLLAKYDGDGGGGCDPLSSIERTDLSGDTGAEEYFTVDVKDCMSKLTVTMSGSSNNGDADLYLKANAKPTVSDFDCRPYRWGNSETCTVDNVAPGTYHIMLRGYAAYNSVNLLVETE